MDLLDNYKNKPRTPSIPNLSSLSSILPKDQISTDIIYNGKTINCKIIFIFFEFLLSQNFNFYSMLRLSTYLLHQVNICYL